MNLNELKIGDKIKTRDVYSPDLADIIVETLGEELMVVGKTVSFVSSTDVMTEIKQWAPGFDPEEYE